MNYQNNFQNLITELQSYDQETHHLEEELHKIPADLEAQKLLSNLEEIQTKITTLLTQAEQGRATLEGARGYQEQRGHDIHAYKKFLDETDSWLKDIVASMKQEPPITTNKVRLQYNIYINEIILYREKFKFLFLLKKDINSNESLIKRNLDLLFVFEILNKNFRS